MIVNLSKSLFIGLGILTIVILIGIIGIICTTDLLIDLETKIIDRKPNRSEKLHEFLQKQFDGRVLEFNKLDNLMKSGDGFTSEIRALQLKLVKSNNSNEVNAYKILFLF